VDYRYNVYARKPTLERHLGAGAFNKLSLLTLGLAGVLA